MLGQSEASHQHALEEREAQLLLVFVAQTRYPGPIFYAASLHGSFDVRSPSRYSVTADQTTRSPREQHMTIDQHNDLEAIRQLKALSEDGNPQLGTVLKIAKALGLEFRVKPAA